jgi:sugar lactone lactonase YvrE
VDGWRNLGETLKWLSKSVKRRQPYLELDCALGEGPFYEEGTGVLRFLDIIKNEMHTVNLQQGVESHKVVQLEDSVG